VSGNFPDMCFFYVGGTLLAFLLSGYAAPLLCGIVALAILCKLSNDLSGLAQARGASSATSRRQELSHCANRSLEYSTMTPFSYALRHR
jgi:hypothetical protein